MIYWFLLAGVVAGAIWKLTGGRLGHPRDESLVAFFRRVAERSPTVPEPLTPGLERGRDGLARASRVRPELRWRQVPLGGQGLELWQSWRGGRPLPVAPQVLVTATAVVEGSQGPSYALIGDWSGYREELRDRWVLLETIVQREPEADAARSAAEVVKRVLATPLTPGGRVSVSEVQAVARGEGGAPNG